MTWYFEPRRAAMIAMGGTLVVVSVGLAFWETPLPESEVSRRTAESVVSESPDEAWPPAAGDLERMLDITAVRILSESATYDGGVDASPSDAGPPIALPEGLVEGVQVRRGRFEDIYYLEVVIGPASLDDPLPILFVLHGRGGQAQLPGGPFLELAHPVRVIVPQAPDRLGAGYEWLPVSVGSGLIDRLSSSLFQVSSRIAQMIRVLVRERPTKGRPIVCGFSQGGLITYSLALHHDDVVAHAFPLSTWLPPPLEPLYRREDLRYPPIRSMHGTDDPIIPVAPTRALVERLRLRGFDVELVEFEGAVHEMNDAMNQRFRLWLQRAVCAELGDRECVAAADPDSPDAGLVLEDGGGIDDAGADAGRARRRRRDAGGSASGR